MLTQIHARYGVPLHRTSIVFEYFSRLFNIGSIRLMLRTDCLFRCISSISIAAFHTSWSVVDWNVLASVWLTDPLNFSKACLKPTGARLIVSMRGKDIGFAMIKKDKGHRSVEDLRFKISTLEMWVMMRGRMRQCRR